MTTNEMQALEAIANATGPDGPPVTARQAGLDGSRARQLGQLVERGHLKRGPAQGTRSKPAGTYSVTAKGRRILAA